MSHGIETPKLEIIVRAHDREVAIIAFFPDAEGSVDCLVGVEEPGSVDLVVETLRAAALGVESCKFARADFSPNGDVSNVANGKDDHPF